MQASSPRILLQLEGGAVLAACLGAYAALHGSRWLFAALLLMPDISMLGYLINKHVGAEAYNAVHTEIGPLLAGFACIVTHHPASLLLCLIWLAHIGMDRMLGYGLKYETAFKDTHLQRVRNEPRGEHES